MRCFAARLPMDFTSLRRLAALPLAPLTAAKKCENSKSSSFGIKCARGTRVDKEPHPGFHVCILKSR